MDMEDHVTGRITDGRSRMGGRIVEEPLDFIIGLLGALGLLGGDRVEGGKHGQVNGNGVVQHGPDDLLDKSDGPGWQDRIFVGVIGPLDCCTIHIFLTGMGGILRALWRLMLELVEGSREVVVHGGVAGFPDIFPVPCISPVDGDIVQLAEGLD